jgi:hypothetical protein
MRLFMNSLFGEEKIRLLRYYEMDDGVKRVALADVVTVSSLLLACCTGGNAVLRAG